MVNSHGDESLASQINKLTESKMETTHVTIENTKKKFKAQLLLCHVVAITSLIVVSQASSIDSPHFGVTLIASLAWLSATIWWVVTKSRIWWNHA